MLNPTLAPLATHLEFLGYAIESKESRFFIAKHGRYLDLAVTEHGFGVLFAAFLAVTDAGKADPFAVLHSLNAFNRKASVCRGYIDTDEDLVIEAAYPKAYDKAAFGTFIETLNHDISASTHDDVKLSQYLS